MPKPNLIKIFEKAKTFNKFLILYLLMDNKPRSKFEIMDDITAERKIIPNTILTAIDSLVIHNLIALDEEDQYILIQEVDK